MKRGESWDSHFFKPYICFQQSWIYNKNNPLEFKYIYIYEKGCLSKLHWKIKIMDVYLKDLRVESLIFEEFVEVFIRSCDYVIY